MAEVSFRRFPNTDCYCFRFISSRGDADTFERKFARLFLRSDLRAKYLECHQPAFVLAAEAVEELIPFLTRYLLCRHAISSSNSGRESLRRLPSFPKGTTFERLQRAGFIK